MTYFITMGLFNSDTCDVVHIGDSLVLQCHGIMHTAEFRKGLLQALRFARENHVKKWLLDLRQIGKLREEEETWVQVQLFPQIMMHLGTGNHMAVVVDERCYHDMLDESGLMGLKSYNSFIIINTFCQLQEAFDWLAQKQSKCA